MAFSDVVERLDVTRARIESSVTEPTVIAITSAKSDDGKTLLAAALAQSFAGVGYSVLLVGANQYATPMGALRSAPKLSDRSDYDILAYVKRGAKGSPDLLELTAPGVAASCSKETTEATFERFRSAYPFTIVHTSVLSQSGVAFSFVSASDQVVIAFQAGRAGGEPDRNLVELLKSASASVAGTVLLDRKSLRAFEIERRASLQATRLTLSSPVEETTKGTSVGVRAG